MKKLPIGIQTFRDTVEGNYVYVEKTLLLTLSRTTDALFYLVPRNLENLFFSTPYTISSMGTRSFLDGFTFMAMGFRYEIPCDQDNLSWGLLRSIEDLRPSKSY